MKVKLKLTLDHPTIVVQLTPAGLKVSLEAWQHAAPVGLLSHLDLRVQQAIHEWRARFLAQGTVFGTPNARQQDAADEQQADQTNRRQS